MNLKTFYQDNIINYDTVIDNAIINILNKNDDTDVSIIVPIMGRENQIRPLVNSFKESFKYYKEKKYSLTFVEHDENPNNQNTIKSTGSNYIFIKRENNERFNKCLCMNVGALIIKANYFLFHDVDIVVKKDFLKNIFLNFGRINNDKVLHCLSEKRVVYLNAEKSGLVRNKNLNVDDIDNIAPYSEPEPKEIMYGNYGAPGGSIIIKSDLFFKIGGYDDSFFSGYSPEDDFFWRKIELFEKINGCDDPKNILFHLHHEPLHHTRMAIHELIKSIFLNSDKKLKMEYINLKSKNLKYGKIN
jgi:predicted glycosyltransferase involved in capsule biosynthesis